MESLLSRPLWELERQRVLVVGGGGWLGRSAIEVLDRIGVKELLITGSKPRKIGVRGVEKQVAAHSLEVVEAFAPNVVINCAFLTREKELMMTASEYERANRRLIQNFLEIVSMSSVHSAVTISSGAAVHPNLRNGLYGKLKREEESLALALNNGEKTVVVGRAWSLSGSYVQRPEAYAFSNLILQGLEGQELSIRAEGPVWRRYCDARQFISVILSRAIEGEGGLIDSGGDLIEIEALATSIATFLGVGCNPRYGLKQRPDRYHSDGADFESLLEMYGLRRINLESQIREVALSLRASYGTETKYT